MPEPLWISLMALLYLTNVTTCSAIADACDSVSHDRLTRMLQGTWSGHTRLDLALRLLFTVAGGYLIVADTVVAKPYARLLGEAAWVWSQKDRQVQGDRTNLIILWPESRTGSTAVSAAGLKPGTRVRVSALQCLTACPATQVCTPSQSPARAHGLYASRAESW